MLKPVSKAGTCRYCKCTEGDACRLADGDTCSWLDMRRNCCTNPACIKALAAEVREEERKRREALPRRKSSAEISQLIRRRGRKLKPKVRVP